VPIPGRDHLEPNHAVVRVRRLTWDRSRLSLGPAAEEPVRLTERDAGFVAVPSPGKWLALHWKRTYPSQR
jgi:hypothetical protein